MILSFNIEYRTNWGEEVRISGLFPESIPLHTTDGIYWTAELELEVPQEGMTINYSYQIEQNGIVIRKEWDSFSRSIFLSGSSRKIYRINDCWKNIPEQLYLYSSAFTEALLAHPEKENIPQRYKKGLVIKAYAPRINKDYCLAICGNQKSLGHWDPEKAVLMSDTNFPEWQIELDASKLKYPLEYKFILYNKQEKKADCWEKNPNRYLADPELKTNETLVISDRYVYFDIPAWKGAGIAIPVFSLKSEKSFGVGDFGDLKRMVDWAVNTRQKVIQILPVNDTTMTHAWTDSYPYNSISIYAFHPMYADIRQMGTLKDKEAASKFSKKQKELNSLPAIDYEAVNQTKWEFFNLLFRQEGARLRVSVCGTGTSEVMFSGFSRQSDYLRCWIVPKDAPYCQVRLFPWICLRKSTPTLFNGLFRQPAAVSLLLPHVTLKGSNGILTVSAIGLAVRLSLRTRLTLIRLALIRKP